ncbi:MAG TPA: CHAT domain-containing protein [Thermoanaerobaculia bacterium]
MSPVGKYEATAAQFEEAYREFLAYEQWQAAAQVRMQAADWSYRHGLRGEFLAYLDEALQLAETHGLTKLADQLRIKKYHSRLAADPTGEALQELKRELKRLRASAGTDAAALTDLELLAARRLIALEVFDSAAEYLEAAQDAARSLPHKQWLVQLELARWHEAQQQIEEAIRHAEEALPIVRSLQIPMEIAQVLVTSIPLRTKSADSAQHAVAEQELEELRRIGSPEDYAQALLGRAQAYYERQEFHLSLADLGRAEQASPTAEQRRRVIEQKLLSFHSLEQYEEALDVAQRAVAFLEDQLNADTADSGAEWRDRLDEFENLHVAAAWLLAKMERGREAFEWAEKGRAQSMRRELARLGIAAEARPARTTFNEVHAWLAAEQAAMLVFAVLNWGTLALLLDPRASDPQIFFLPLTGGRLRTLLGPQKETRTDTELWTEDIFNSAADLSEQLLNPDLAEALRRAAGYSDILYILPDSYLYLAPFAALKLGDAGYLIESFALACAPSAAVLAWCRSLHLQQRTSACLAVGAGESEGHKFAEQARAVADLPWRAHKVLLDEVTPEQVLGEAPQFPVLHLACHGSVSSDTLETMSASRLELGNGRKLTAKDVLQLDGRLRAELVFMNVCQGGRFRMLTRTDVGGFVRAFIQAGTATVVAPLVHVHPESAQTLAMEYYRRWMQGDVTKAEALRQAQLQLLREGIEGRHWASHVLFGDYR